MNFWRIAVADYRKDYVVVAADKDYVAVVVFDAVVNVVVIVSDVKAVGVVAYVNFAVVAEAVGLHDDMIMLLLLKLSRFML